MTSWWWVLLLMLLLFVVLPMSGAYVQAKQYALPASLDTSKNTQLVSDMVWLGMLFGLLMLFTQIFSG